jgi:hypothetical protein
MISIHRFGEFVVDLEEHHQYYFDGNRKYWFASEVFTDTSVPLPETFAIQIFCREFLDELDPDELDELCISLTDYQQLIRSLRYHIKSNSFVPRIEFAPLILISAKYDELASFLNNINDCRWKSRFVSYGMTHIDGYFQSAALGRYLEAWPGEPFQGHYGLDAFDVHKFLLLLPFWSFSLLQFLTIIVQYINVPENMSTTTHWEILTLMFDRILHDLSLRCTVSMVTLAPIQFVNKFIIDTASPLCSFADNIATINTSLQNSYKKSFRRIAQKFKTISSCVELVVCMPSVINMMGCILCRDFTIIVKQYLMLS